MSAHGDACIDKPSSDWPSAVTQKAQQDGINLSSADCSMAVMINLNNQRIKAPGVATGTGAGDGTTCTSTEGVPVRDFCCATCSNDPSSVCVDLPASIWPPAPPDVPADLKSAWGSCSSLVPMLLKSKGLTQCNDGARGVCCATCKSLSASSGSSSTGDGDGDDSKDADSSCTLRFYKTDDCTGTELDSGAFSHSGAFNVKAAGACTDVEDANWWFSMTEASL